MKVLKTDNKVKVYLRRCLVKERNMNFSWKAWEIISEQLKGDSLFGQETLRGVISTELCGHKNISFLGLVPFLLIYFFFSLFFRKQKTVKSCNHWNPQERKSQLALRMFLRAQVLSPQTHFPDQRMAKWSLVYWQIIKMRLQVLMLGKGLATIIP